MMMVQFRAAGSSSMMGDQFHRAVNRTVSDSTSTATEGKSAVLSAQSSLNSDLGPKVKDIFLSSNQGDKFVVPVLIAVQLSSKLRRYVANLERAVAVMGRYDILDYCKRQSLEVPCSTVVLKTLVDFFIAKLQLDVKLTQAESVMSITEQQEYWRDYFYVRVAWRMDLDMFADETLQVAECLQMNSLYDLLWCCFRVRVMSQLDQKDAAEIYMD